MQQSRGVGLSEADTDAARCLYAERALSFGDLRDCLPENAMRFPSIALAAAVWLGAAAWPSACQGTTILFQDSFDRLQPTWGEESDSFKVVDSQLEVSPAADSYHWSANSANLYDDIDMCVTMTTIATAIRSRRRPASSSGMSTSTTSTCSSSRRTAWPRSGGGSAASGWPRSTGGRRRAPTRATARSTSCG